MLAKATESEVYLVIPEDVPGLEEAVTRLRSWAEVTLFRDKAILSVIGRNIVGFEGLGDKVISLSGKVYLANVSANMMSENFVIDSDRLDATLSGIHGYIFGKEDA